MITKQMQINAYADLEVALSQMLLIEELIQKVRAQVGSAYMKSHTKDEEYDDQDKWNAIRKAEYDLLELINQQIGVDSSSYKIYRDIIYIQSHMTLEYGVFIEADIEED